MIQSRCCVVLSKAGTPIITEEIIGLRLSFASQTLVNWNKTSGVPYSPCFVFFPPILMACHFSVTKLACFLSFFLTRCQGVVVLTVGRISSVAEIP